MVVPTSRLGSIDNIVSNGSRTGRVVENTMHVSTSSGTRLVKVIEGITRIGRSRRGGTGIPDSVDVTRYSAISRASAAGANYFFRTIRVSGGSSTEDIVGNRGNGRTTNGNTNKTGIVATGDVLLS